jgi:hypothetical protein
VLLAILALSRSSAAQVPGAMPGPILQPVPGPPCGPVPAPTVWDRLGMCCDDCCAQCCASPLGQLLNAMTKPLCFATGGLIQPICSCTPTPAQLKRILDPESPASDAEKMAALIKVDEAAAARRRAAVRYLGTVDCHYFPEAESALISGLRCDRNECVRFEAALALSKGCCSTKNTIAALLIAANGSAMDGNPSETSERVRAVARYALELCTARAGDWHEQSQPAQQEAAAAGGKKTAAGIQLAAYYTQQVPKQTQTELIDQASRYLAETISTSPATRTLAASQRTVAGMMANLGSPSAGSAADADEAFDEAVLMLPELRAPAPADPTSGPAAPPAGTPRGEELRPLRLTAPSALIQQGP